ncbi:MAG: histidinol-phosphate transaminase [Gloeomargaritaceae cyanobacterium C42_A2020_066]|nr:histidinol-phosphate transaminase [Gloeomargaritaceae cyanobacterium C42_A2020_066]
MLPCLRPDLVDLAAYAAHPEETVPLPESLDRLDANENPYELPAELKAKLAWIYQHDLRDHRYPDGQYPKLKQAIADYVSATAGRPVSPAQITVGNGSDELIRSLLIATCAAGRGSILVADPTFGMYAILAATLGIPVIRVPRDPDTWQVDLAAAQEQLAGSDIRVVFMVHPNSPTGNGLTEAEMAWLRQLPDSTLVVIDEAYFEFSGQTVLATAPLPPHWVILRTFSKAFRLAGQRVGYGVADPEVIRILEKVRLPYNLPSMAQAAAQVVLQHWPEVLAVIPELRQARQDLYAALAPLPDLRVWPSQANFLFLHPAPGNDPLAVQQHLAQRGTLVRATGGGLRISLGTPDQNHRTRIALEKRFGRPPTP